MAITTTKDFRKNKSLKVNSKTGIEKYKPVNSMTYSELTSYIINKYLPKLESVSNTFNITGGNFEYDLKDPKSKNLLLNYYKEQADYNEVELDNKTNYRVNDWAILRKEIDTDTDELVFEKKLKENSNENTYNKNYLGIIDLNYKFYYDNDFDKWFVLIHPHLSGDIRGNYGEALVLEGDDMFKLKNRFENKFVNGSSSIKFKFTDNSEVVFNSENDSDIFSFRQDFSNEIERGTIAEKLVDDFNSIMDKSKSDVFLETIVDEFFDRKKIDKKNKGGVSSSEKPSVCIEIIETGERQWFDLTEYNNGADVIDAINSYIEKLNENDNKNRSEYISVEWSGFGENYFSEYMGEENFDIVLEAWDSFKASKFPISVIYEYMEDTKNNDMDSAIDSMNENLYGVFNSYYDLGNKFNFDLDINEVDIDSISKKKLASEYADKIVDEMSDSEILSYAQVQDEISDINKGINIFKDDINEYNNDISELGNKVMILESQLDESDEDDIDVIVELIVEKNDEIDKLKNKVLLLEKNISEAENEIKIISKKAKEISRSEIYNEYYEEIDNNLYDFLTKNYKSFKGKLDSEFLKQVPFLKVNFEELGKKISKDFLVIESENDIYLFKNYGNGKVLSTTKPSKKYKFFIIELENKLILFGSETKEEAEFKKEELLSKNNSVRVGIYKRDYAERRLNLDVDNSNNWTSDSDLKNAHRVPVVKINKKSLGGWLEKQWFEADFGDGVGATKFFVKGGKVPAYWNSGENITIFDYKTKNFDICGGAVEMFNNAVKDILSPERKESYQMGLNNDEKNDIFSVKKSAEFLDVFFGIEKEIISENKSHLYQIDYALTNLLQAQILFGRYDRIGTLKFASNHIIEMIKRLDKSELKFSDGGKVLYDHEGDMAKSELQKIEKYAKYLDENIKTDTQLMAWVQSKISRMATDMGDVKHYMEYQINNKKAMGGLVIGGIAVLVGAMSIYFINKHKKTLRGGNELHTRLGWVQDQSKRSKQEHEIQYQKKKLKK